MTGTLFVLDRRSEQVLSELWFLGDELTGRDG